MPARIASMDKKRENKANIPVFHKHTYLSMTTFFSDAKVSMGN